MARPIKETPILYGEDARRFAARMKEQHPLSPEKRAEVEYAYQLIMEMFKRGEEIERQQEELDQQ